MTRTAMQIVVDSRGQSRCLYGEQIDLAALGQMHIVRASHVEPDETGGWQADLAPVGGPRLGPFALRSAALAAEGQWLIEHWLCAVPSHVEKGDEHARIDAQHGLGETASSGWAR